MKILFVLFSLLFTFSVTASEKNKTVTLSIEGMTCQSCVGTVEKALKKVNGVKEAKVDLKNKQATVTVATAKTTPALLIKAVSDAGFDATERTATAPASSKKGSSMNDESCGDGCCDDESKPAKEKKKKS